MQQKITIVTIVLVALLVVGSAVGAFLATSGDYKKEASGVSEKIEEKKAEINEIKARKDVNGFTPTEVVKFFFTEVKADSVDTAKLYLAPDAQEMDIKATLKLGSDLANITTGESLEEEEGDEMRVDMTFVLADDTTTVRSFLISKYDDAWKIVGVIAI